MSDHSSRLRVPGRILAGGIRAGSGVPSRIVITMFEAVREKLAELTLSEFHNGLKRLHDTRAIRLLPAAEMTEPEYALVIGGRLLYLAAR